ncbi:hypothetical protein [Allobranchiibius sp. GilTou73]|uniref:hypothetical protein n=1 Tax=Allobranchiibius sp. GilTou73 TaxID=2904523 RepID=UPI001F393910|nr:hypothetical protein [Allobranchiibius sp. GilTou73]UIJ33372.1 hypothetical protein LVQ62_09225 [Allobranchiibius sp. GilTou73]
MTTEFTPLRRIQKPLIEQMTDPNAVHTVGMDPAEVFIPLSGQPAREWIEAFGANQNPFPSSGGIWDGEEPPIITGNKIKFWAPLAEVEEKIVKINQRIDIANDLYAQHLRDQAAATASFEERAAQVADKWDTGDN